MRDTICQGCQQPLLIENAWMTDGCPCNSESGCNDGNQLISEWRASQLNLAKHTIEKLEEDRDKFKRYNELRRELIDLAHLAFHNLTQDSHAPYCFHSPEDDNNPAVWLQTIAAERDSFKQKAAKYEELTTLFEEYTRAAMGVNKGEPSKVGEPSVEQSGVSSNPAQ